jgi:hypothetical protein
VHFYKVTKMPADNLRFGATAAGRADLNGGGGMPPLRQAAVSLCVSGESAVRKQYVSRREYDPTALQARDKRHKQKNCNLVI